MKIEAVDLFYLSMPVVKDIGDGSQDALLIRVAAGGYVGWGQCEAAPLPCIAAWNCPMSHSACKPVSASVLGQRLDEPRNIHDINRLVRAQSFDLLQADHLLSGIDIALWDLMGKQLEEPVWQVLGYQQAFPKMAYASQLFGDDAQATHRKAQVVRKQGFRAAKFGWGPYGRGTAKQDAEQVRAAREGIGGEEVKLMVDAGTVWGDDVARAEARLQALKECGVLWLEEPFVSGALGAYAELARRSSPVSLAAGEGCNNFQQAKSMIDYAGLGFIQIDAGRIGGISTGREVADYARKKEVSYVNHTFTTQLSLTASLQPYAEREGFCEYPIEPSELAKELTTTKLVLDREGYVHLPEGPGLGVEVNLEAVKKYMVEVEVRVSGKSVYRSPEV